MDAWVIVQGWETRLSTPPRDSARAKCRSPSTNASTAARPPRSSKERRLPQPSCCTRAKAWPGCSGRLGWLTRFTASLPRRRSTTRKAFASWTWLRAWSVRMPRRVRKESNGAPVTPIALAHQASCSCTPSSPATAAPPSMSLWPLMNFVVEWITMSAPSDKGRWLTGDRKVLSATHRAPASWAKRAQAAMSTIRMRGLLGVSSQIMRGRRARTSSRAPGRVWSTKRTR